jgi:prohibitin 1
MFEANQDGGMTPRIPKLFVVGFIAFLLIMISGGKMFYTVDPGEKAILFKRFGGGLDKEKVYDQGFHVVAPWNKFYTYNVKIQEDFEAMEVLSKNGLSIKVDLSFRYSPVMSEIGYLHDLVGKEYLESIIRPEIRSVTREVIGEYLPEELYSTKREEVEDKIFEITSQSVVGKHINLDAILIRDVTLPKTLQAAIENKLRQEQEALEYEFKLLKEKKEAERKRIEAAGISDFQRIVTKTITPQLLKWKGVETTQELAKSPNSKIVVIGNGDGDLPIILGGEK